MERYIIKLSYPAENDKQSMENTAIARVKITPDTKIVYNAVGWFEDHMFPELKVRLANHRIKKRVRLRSVVNIHNSDGIRDVGQIKRMIKSISRGRDTLTRSGMPNVKLYKTKKRKLFLFDGHHSLLAYMSSGRKYLNSIPYLLIERNNNGRLDDSNIFDFFGGLLSREESINWLQYAVNWQAPKKAQLCQRLEKNMGELYDTIQVVMK